MPSLVRSVPFLSLASRLVQWAVSWEQTFMPALIVDVRFQKRPKHALIAG